MTSKLGVYWSVMHRRPQDYDYFKRLQPSVFKIMDGGPPDYQFARENLPDSLVLARDWALSEQHSDMLKDPIGTGKRHAQEWNGHQARLGFDKAKTLILGVNEPKVWDAGVSEALRQYTIALCDEATIYGLRVGAMQLSVGWPANNGPDTPPDWSPWHGVDVAIRHNNGALVLHEYWADAGPAENWGWWAGRALKCPWQVPIVIGETGIDMYVKDGSVPHANRGWRGHKDAQQYAYELAGYTGRMAQDPRFVGNAVFASDFANGEWASFDIEPAYQAILAVPIPVPSPIDESQVFLPSIGTGPQPAQPPTPPMPTGILDPRVLQAILQIESGGRTHGESGKPIIRFEAHIFRQMLGNDALWHDLFRTDSLRPWTNQERRLPSGEWVAIHTGNQKDEWAAYEVAKSIDAEAAAKSISMGAGQIMGFNHARIGYPSAQAMLAAFQSAPVQTIGFINFFLSDPALVDAMRRKDWDEIARRYNGSGNAAVYSPLLQEAYEELGA